MRGQRFSTPECLFYRYLNQSGKSAWTIGSNACKSVQILTTTLRSAYDLPSHTTYVVFVNFIHDCRDLQFNVES